MTSLSTFLMVVIVLLVGIAGYYYLDQISPLQAALEEAKQQDQELLFQIEQLKQENEELSKQLDEKVKELSEEKETEIEKLKSTYDDLISGLQEQIKKGEITITRLADQLNVNIVDRILFPSGEAEITAGGIRVLTRVGDILKQTKNKRIKVEGHTDNVPIHPKLQKKYPTNWELSVARATNVVRFLHDKIGIHPKNLQAAGFAEFRPIATNKTKKGRAQNRRIEIVLLPKSHKIESLTKK
ncbi:MAG: OmpA family protein [bacterium]